MKKYIKSASDSSEYLDILSDAGIDTTKMRYELKAEKYERYNPGGACYTIRFSAPGDYIAYMSMYTHGPVSPDDVIDLFDSFEDMVDALPTVQMMEHTAESTWWGDGDDYIYYLKNLTTGKVLYEGDYEPEEDIIEDDAYDW